MKVLQVYNDYRTFCGGESAVVEMIAATVRKHGGDARLLTRSSKGVDSLWSKFRAFASSIYSRSAYREMTELLRADRPDVVHAHNLYPWFSPSVLVACRREGVPVVMTNHNYRLTCPIVNHLYKGRVCEKCLGGREHWCVLRNCRENRLESLAYYLRSVVARKLRLFHDNVTIQIVLNEFAKQRLAKAGFDEHRIAVLPNMVPLASGGHARTEGDYVAYSGRMMPEKGVEMLLAAAARLPDVPFRLAGDGPLLTELMFKAPPNATFVNRLDAKAMAAFYRNARLLAVPSVWFEGCPLVVSEAMSHGLPVVASRIGGLPELVDDNVTGLLFSPGNVDELTSQLRRLWESPVLCRQMGTAGRKKAGLEYGEEIYYQRLMAIYRKAIALTPQQCLSHKTTESNGSVPHSGQDGDERRSLQSASRDEWDHAMEGGIS